MQSTQNHAKLFGFRLGFIIDDSCPPKHSFFETFFPFPYVGNFSRCFVVGSLNVHLSLLFLEDPANDNTRYEYHFFPVSFDMTSCWTRRAYANASERKFSESERALLQRIFLFSTTMNRAGKYSLRSRAVDFARKSNAVMELIGTTAQEMRPANRDQKWLIIR